MVVIGRNWLGSEGIGWARIDSDRVGRICKYLQGIGRIRKNLEECGRNWMHLEGIGWMWKD